nr:GNAT family N-acetyltransferase [uncultured Cellulosilyticum sp.]
MRKLGKEEMGKIAGLFEGNQDTLIWSCLEGVMGSAWCDELGTAAQVINGDFCFFSGDARGEEAELLVRHIPEEYPNDYLLMVPGDRQWGDLIEKVYGEKCYAFKRYAFKKEGDVFDRQKLEGFIQSLPAEFTICPIDEKMYERCLEEEWSKDLCAQFKSGEDYVRNGFGFVICYEHTPVCGASSYTRYRKGIEIEIDTREDFRRRGLATACAAKLILASLDKGLYPSWDAANLHSVALAKKLGYHLSHEYITYSVLSLKRI